MSANTAEKLEFFPALAEMGIVRFHEIAHYSLRQDGADKDVLRINYKRAKGSFLPYSRKYKFGRSIKTVIADGGTARMESTYEISPFLLKAIAELDVLVQKNEFQDHSAAANADIKSDLLSEIAELDQLINSKQAVDKAIAAKLASVRQHIEAL
jgi:hypothetical protein